ncbi:MAG: hypothetical protein AB1553_06205 [Nitrospirota bacterium]
MKPSLRSACLVFCALLLIAAPAVAGLVVAPTHEEAQASIIDYYEKLGYEVRVLELGSIERIPIGDRVFGGTPGFSVEVKSITLAAAEGTRGAAGEQTFTNATVRIREKSDRQGEWVVFNVANIPVK